MPGPGFFPEADASWAARSASASRSASAWSRASATGGRATRTDGSWPNRSAVLASIIAASVITKCGLAVYRVAGLLSVDRGGFCLRDLARRRERRRGDLRRRPPEEDDVLERV